MAQGQENTDSKFRVLNIKLDKGSNLDDRISDYLGDEDCSGSEFLRRAVEALLAASGRPAPVAKPATSAATAPDAGATIA